MDDELVAFCHDGALVGAVSAARSSAGRLRRLLFLGHRRRAVWRVLLAAGAWGCGPGLSPNPGEALGPPRDGGGGGGGSKQPRPETLDSSRAAAPSAGASPSEPPPSPRSPVPIGPAEAPEAGASDSPAPLDDSAAPEGSSPTSTDECPPGCEDAPEPGTPCGRRRQYDANGVCAALDIGRLAAGTRHTCAIVEGGSVLCWGDNRLGQLGAAFDQPVVGDDETPASLPELKLSFPEPVIQLAAGHAHTCALLQGGAVRCWGGVEDPDFLRDGVEGGPDPLEAVLGTRAVAFGASGFVDPLSTANVPLPEPASEISVAHGGWYACAVLDSGRLACWGDNALGQLGQGVRGGLRPNVEQPIPLIELPRRVLHVSTGPAHACAVLEGGELTCWGGGNFGRLGYASSADRLVPGAIVDVGAPVREVVAATRSTCVITDAGRVRCWGDNDDGELGYGHTTGIGEQYTPRVSGGLLDPVTMRRLGGDVDIAGSAPAQQLVALVRTAAYCALLDSGAVRCWGSNEWGELGYGHALDLSEAFTPDQLAARAANTERNAGGDVALGAPAVALATGGRCALLATGDILCWGRNEEGVLGQPGLALDASRTSTPEELGPIETLP